MSLTTFVNAKYIRARLAQEFPKPRLTEKPAMLAPPQTKNYAFVGTAFDYLLRFHLQCKNPQARTNDWVAEHGISFLKTHKELFAQACEMMRRAKSDYAAFLETGKMTDSLVQSVMFLAKMDSLYRIGPMHPVFLGGQEGNLFRRRFLDSDKGDEADLKKLVSILPKTAFKTKRLCILNPTFGDASVLVGGGDADLVLDDMLIEIKTTKNFELSRECFNQLIGYYCLHKIGGIDGAPKNYEIHKLGVYFPRHAYLWSVATKDVFDNSKFIPFLRWFKKEANRPEEWEGMQKLSPRKQRILAAFVKSRVKELKGKKKS